MIKEINDRYYQECKVVMISNNKEIHSVYMKDSLELHTDCKLYLNGIEQHLYITSDEEIKEGDLFYYEAEKTIMQCTEHNFYFTPELIQNYSNVYKIIVTTDTSLKLPNIPQQFIEKYIEEYNKGNVITKVDVEYEAMDISTMTSDVKTYPNLNIETLKLNSDNTINIKPIKTSWNREEVIGIIHSICGNMYKEHIIYSPLTVNEWIKENL